MIPLSKCCTPQSRQKRICHLGNHPTVLENLVVIGKEMSSDGIFEERVNINYVTLVRKFTMRWNSVESTKITVSAAPTLYSRH